MEIIHLILGKANPDRMNGVNKVVYQLTTQQALSGRKVSIWGISSNLEHNYGERNFETRLFLAHKNPFKIDKKLKKELSTLKGKAVIHFHGGWVPIYSSLSRFLSKHRIPFVLTPHGAYNTVAMNRSGKMKQIYFQLFEKKMLKRAAKIHSLGESEVEGLNLIYPNSKSVLIPYGFEIDTKASSQDLKSENFIIGFVGRLDIYTKGLDLLVKAFSRFSKDKADVKLWIIGDSNEKGVLEKMIQTEGCFGNTVLWGSKFAQEKDDLIKQMSIFVHSSRNEGLPTAVLEAASFGVPSVVTKATNVSSYVNNYQAGISVPNENESALEEAFSNLYSMWENNNLNALKSNAQSMVKEAFKWSKVVEDFDVLYNL